MAEAKDFLIDGPVGKLSVRTKGMEASPRNVIVLVQGSNLSGQTGYDFSFGGRTDFSMMDAIVDRPGSSYGAVTFALRGYGKSSPPEDPLACGTDSAVEDLAAVMDWLKGEGYDKAAFLGWSWGARIIGHYVAANPARAARVAFLGPAIGGGDPVLPAPDEPWWYNTREEYRNRLDPTMMDQDALEALIEHIATQDPKAPNAIRVENARGSVPINPEAITCPALVVMGSEGGKAVYMKGVMPIEQFYARLATRDKQLAMVPDSSDYAMFQRKRRQVQYVICSFLESTP